MKRRFVWLMALVGLLWLFRRALQRPEPVHISAGDDLAGDDPAGELRRKLGETRSRADGEVEDAVPASGATADEIDAKRRTLHDQARSAADDMRRSATD